VAALLMLETNCDLLSSPLQLRVLVLDASNSRTFSMAINADLKKMVTSSI